MGKLTPETAEKKLSSYARMVAGWGGIPNYDEQGIILKGLERILADSELEVVHPSAVALRERISLGNARGPDTVEPVVRPHVAVVPGAVSHPTGTVYGTFHTGAPDTQYFREPPFNIGSIVRVRGAEYAYSGRGITETKLFAKSGRVKVLIDNSERELEQGWSGNVRITGQSSANPFTYHATPLEEAASKPE